METKQMPDHHGPRNEGEAQEYPNQTIELLLERTSCRSFTDQKIPDDVLDYILRAGAHAPTGGNLQPYSIIKIEKPETKETLAEWCGQKFIGSAPVDLIFCIDWHRTQRWAELEVAPYSAPDSLAHFWISFQDTMAAAQNICTAADAFGLGSVYIGTIMQFFQEIHDLLELPKGVMPVVLLCLGYPKTKAAPRKKLGTEIIVHSEKYREPSDEEILAAFNEKYSNRKIEITDDRLQTLEKVAREVHGEEFAKKCIAKVMENGYINNVQRYFGLHYMANELPSYNLEFQEIMEKFGFNWFKEFKLKV